MMKRGYVLSQISRDITQALASFKISGQITDYSAFCITALTKTSPLCTMNVRITVRPACTMTPTFMQPHRNF